MSLINEKSSVFTQIGALNSVNDEFTLPNPTNSLSSVNNRNEPVPFFLDLLTVLVGSEALKSTVGELMTGFIRNVQPTLESELRNQFLDFNSDEVVPSSFQNSGYNIDAKTIDSYGKLRTDPSSQLGNIIYGNVGNDFDRVSYNAISNPGTNVNYNNLTINYNDTLDQFNYKPVFSNQPIGTFLDTYIDNLVLINEPEFIGKINNQLFGTTSINQNKTVNDLVLEDKINKTLEKIINEEESIEISDNELREIERNAQLRSEGINQLDVGCGVINTSLSLDNLSNLVDTTTSSNDPLTVGNAYVSALNSSFSPNQENQLDENRETIQDNFFKRLINTIVLILVSSITVTPQIRVLIGITSGFKNNNNPNIGDPVEDLSNKRNLINCFSKTAKSTINEFLFDLVKKELLKLIVPVSKIILKEKINQYTSIIRSLTGFI